MCSTVILSVYVPFPDTIHRSIRLLTLIRSQLGLSDAHWRTSRAHFACDHLQEVTGILEDAGKLDELMFTPSGPAGVFAVYATPGFSLGRLFLNEFVCVRTQAERDVVC